MLNSSATRLGEYLPLRSLTRCLPESPVVGKFKKPDRSPLPGVIEVLGEGDGLGEREGLGLKLGYRLGLFEGLMLGDRLGLGEDDGLFDGEGLKKLGEVDGLPDGLSILLIDPLILLDEDELAETKEPKIEDGEADALDEIEGVADLDLELEGEEGLTNWNGLAPDDL